MDYIRQIIEFNPLNEQEQQDKRVMLNYIEKFREDVLLRDNEIAHITSSGFVMNRELDKVLMVNHHIQKGWAWTGGHADGESDLLYVAIKEAKEETGVLEVEALTNDIVSIDILPVYSHIKRGKYINAHLHLSIAYILITSEEEKLTVKEDENSGVKWFDIDKFTEENFKAGDVYLYNKLINRAREVVK
jgi:8-oxo-dGTP pyrophosphatase MutT (NUDIX family)